MNHKGTKTIETERLILRRFKILDYDQMYRNWASEDKVTEFLTWPTHTSPEISKMVLESWVPQYEKSDYYHWGIELKETGELIGGLAVVEVFENTLSANLGYCIGSRYWGNGYVPEAGKAVIKYLFEECGFMRIAACHAYALERFGFPEPDPNAEPSKTLLQIIEERIQAQKEK